MTLPERIIMLREENNLSQEQLAKRLGVSRQIVSMWESDQSIPELDKIIQMSQLFYVTIDYLLKGTVSKARVPSSNTITYDTSSVVQEKIPKPRRRFPRKSIIIFASLLLLILVVVVVRLFSDRILFTSSRSKMEYLFDSANEQAGDYFNAKFAGTSKETEALECLNSAINDRTLDGLVYEHEYWISTLKSLNTDNERIEVYIKGFDVLGLATKITSMKANPDTYNEKEALVIGEFNDNDFSRKMIRLSSDRYSIECSYAGEGIIDTGIKWDEYIPEYSYYSTAVAFGYIRQYNNSNDVYMTIYHYLDSSYSDMSGSELLKELAGWDVIPVDQQEARPILTSMVPSYYPSDLLPLYRLYNVLNCNQSEDNITISYQSNGDFDSVFNYYHELCLSLSGSYIRQNLSKQMIGLTVLLPDSDECVYFLITDGAIIDDSVSKKVTVAIAILNESTYYETEGTTVTS